MKHFGKHIKSLRKKRSLFQKDVSGYLHIDIPMLSKIEKGERKVKKEQLSRLADILGADEKELLTLWLADQVYEVIKDETVAIEALKVAEYNFNYNHK